MYSPESPTPCSAPPSPLPAPPFPEIFIPSPHFTRRRRRTIDDEDLINLHKKLKNYKKIIKQQKKEIVILKNKIHYIQDFVNSF